MRLLLTVYLLAANITAFALYAVDKRRAARHMWRIPESTLLWSAALGGSLGALTAIHCLHHKTKHTRFRLLVPLFFLLHAALFSWLFWKLS